MIMSEWKNFVDDYPEPPDYTAEYLDYEENIECARDYINQDIKRLKSGDTAFAKEVIEEDWYVVPTIDMGELHFDFRLPKDIETYDYMLELEMEMQSAKNNIHEMLEFKGRVYRR